MLHRNAEQHKIHLRVVLVVVLQVRLHRFLQRFGWWTLKTRLLGLLHHFQQNDKFKSGYNTVLYFILLSTTVSGAIARGRKHASSQEVFSTSVNRVQWFLSSQDLPKNRNVQIVFVGLALFTYSTALVLQVYNFWSILIVFVYSWFSLQSSTFTCSASIDKKTIYFVPNKNRVSNAWRYWHLCKQC